MPRNDKCQTCKKPKGKHKARTLQCPRGPKTSVGYVEYEPIYTFKAQAPKVSDAKS